ncbi:MAG TPA: APC family permease [Gammaproteobacteria bacterium]|nr:APC family permease [Gammaproteobacteria bacterium]
MADKKLNVLQATAIAVGTMIGASIFSIFGLGAKLAGHNLPLVFVVSGAVAVLVAYSYAVMGARIVSNAGPMEFVLRAFGDNLLTGSLSFLFWLTYVISLALFAKGFAGYFLPLVHLSGSPLATGAVEVGVIGAFLVLDLLGTDKVGKAEFGIVLIKLAILALFIVLGVGSVNLGWVTPRVDAAHAGGILNGIAVFFLSYMGFGLVTNAAEDMDDPARNVPRAIYLSIAIVTVVYVLVSVVAVGNLSLDRIVQAQDFALAEAAKPFLGQWGYLFVSIGALFSIASALNATLYGGANVAYALARDGELPELFERKRWFHASEGLYITAGLSILFALVFDLNGITSITSAVFMVVYLAVLAAHWRLRADCGGRRLVIITGLVVVGAVFAILERHLWKTDRLAFWTVWGVFAASLMLETVYRYLRGRGFTAATQPDVHPPGRP